jgi:geranylgeranyl pyrophosphate synthase
LAVVDFAKFTSYEILDDLPALDNDRQRRDAPSFWARYGEKNAILFSSILAAFAQHTLLAERTHPDSFVRIKLSNIFNKTDVKILRVESINYPDGHRFSLPEVEKSHDLKAAVWSSFIGQAGAIVADADQETVCRMGEFARALGHCVQIVNDALPDDIGNDVQNNKPNIVAAVGTSETRRIYYSHRERASKILKSFSIVNFPLAEMLDTITEGFEKKMAVTERANLPDLIPNTAALPAPSARG